MLGFFLAEHNVNPAKLGSGTKLVPTVIVGEAKNKKQKTNNQFWDKLGVPKSKLD